MRRGEKNQEGNFRCSCYFHCKWLSSVLQYVFKKKNDNRHIINIGEIRGRGSLDPTTQLQYSTPHTPKKPTLYTPCTSAAKPDPFFGVQPDFGPNFWVQTGQVGPQDPKTGPIGSGWPQRGFKLGFNPIMYQTNQIFPKLG